MYFWTVKLPIIISVICGIKLFLDSLEKLGIHNAMFVDFKRQIKRNIQEGEHTKWIKVIRLSENESKPDLFNMYIPLEIKSKCGVPLVNGLTKSYITKTLVRACGDYAIAYKDKYPILDKVEIKYFSVYQLIVLAIYLYLSGNLLMALILFNVYVIGLVGCHYMGKAIEHTYSNCMPNDVPVSATDFISNLANYTPAVDLGYFRTKTIKKQAEMLANIDENGLLTPEDQVALCSEHLLNQQFVWSIFNTITYVSSIWAVLILYLMA